MQRIDENTYIDDTLVTCAEYQLFLDEMREEGKHYQPDHWVSYQFPPGQARTPIVGVRFSDAKAFCDWLTQLGTGEWIFRLPTSAEIEQNPLKNPVLSPLGYWAVRSDGKSLFVWAEPIPTNPRGLDLNLPVDFDLIHTRDRAIDRPIDFEDTRILYRNLSIAGARNIELIRDYIRGKTRDGTLNRDVYIDICTLQERIAGRSPAFEGIRLVKERIKL